jgi:Ca2+-binding EF-hand superfamily protein
MRILYPWKLLELTANFYIPAMNFPEFTQADINVFIQSFKEFDLDGSGSIDAEELTLAFKAMGQGASEESIQALIESVDLDGSGEIEWVEFLMVALSDLWY